MTVAWLVLIGIICTCMFLRWQTVERRTRMAREWTRTQVVMAPETKHVRILGPVGSVCAVYDWRHEPTLRVEATV